MRKENMWQEMLKVFYCHLIWVLPPSSPVIWVKQAPPPGGGGKGEGGMVGPQCNTTAKNDGPLHQPPLRRNEMVFIFHRFVPPTNVGGIAIDSYAVEYKEARFDWGSARRRVWPVGG
jgi:hypothetical protein